MPYLIKKEGQFWRFATPLLLNYGSPTIFINLLLQTVLGFALESNLGSLRMMIFYLICGIGGTLFGTVASPLYAAGPDPAIFGTVLRFFSQGDRGVKPVIRIPTWMPVMPESLRDAKESKGDPNMVINYLKWAYGSDPVDMENFAEVAAAYHSAKALSYHTDYPHMVERFVNAVAEDKGSAFLFAILLNESQPELLRFIF